MSLMFDEAFHDDMQAEFCTRRGKGGIGKERERRLERGWVRKWGQWKGNGKGNRGK